MTRFRSEIDQCAVVIDTDVPVPANVTIVERKGWGHPDTLADHLAEELSRAYSRYTLAEFGAILHHNFDKLALLGGASEVRYGSGRMTAPVRVLVNGRAARACGGQPVPVDDLVFETVRNFFGNRLPELDGHLTVELNITSNPSPGAVVTGGSMPERLAWFAPRSVDDLRERQVRLANDTSLGTGWAPDHPVESFVRDLVDHLSAPSAFTLGVPWAGSDVKMMAYASCDEVDIVLCAPQKAAHVPSRAAYLSNKDAVLQECERFARDWLPDLPVRFRLNARDLPEHDELYLTYTGSSIESGDEGVVGRGNRINGLITPMRPMNVEGVAGKNPVYHVGKLYNLAAQRLAQRLYEETGAYTEVHLVAATGQRLDRPWRAYVRIAAENPPIDKVNSLLLDTLDNFPVLTDEILTTGLVPS